MKILYVTTGGAPKDQDFLKGILDSGHELHYVTMRKIGLDLSLERAHNYCLDDEIVREDSWVKTTIFKHLSYQLPYYYQCLIFIYYLTFLPKNFLLKNIKKICIYFY